MTHKTVPGLHNYPSPPQSGYHPSQGAALPPSFHTFHLNQQQYPHPQNIYHSQVPYQMPAAWPTAPEKRMGPAANQTDDRQSAKHRARSLDTGPRTNPPVRFTNLPPMPAQQQQQPPIVVAEYRHHRQHHHHHHHQSQPPNIQVTSTDPPVEPGKDQNVPTVRKEMLQSNEITCSFSDSCYSPRSSQSRNHCRKTHHSSIERLVSLHFLTLLSTISLQKFSFERIHRVDYLTVHYRTFYNVLG